MKTQLTSFLLLLSATSVQSFIQTCTSRFQQPVIQSSSSISRRKAAVETLPNKNDSSPHIIFPGGGIFFYWQAGAVTYLLEKNYNLDKVRFTGASAGALTATLTTNNVDFEEATELALKLAEEARVWDRPLGLQGIWGEMIETWLDTLLPEDALKKSQDKLSLLVTPVPSFKTTKISSFESRSDLIDCNMASVHIPLFLDGKFTTSYRNQAHIDGSFLAALEDYHPEASSSEGLGNVLVLDWQQDPFLKDRKLGDFVKALSPEGIWNLLEQGRSYAATMERRGDFSALSSL